MGTRVKRAQHKIYSLHWTLQVEFVFKENVYVLIQFLMICIIVSPENNKVNISFGMAWHQRDSIPLYKRMMMTITYTLLYHYYQRVNTRNTYPGKQKYFWRISCSSGACAAQKCNADGTSVYTYTQLTNQESWARFVLTTTTPMQIDFCRGVSTIWSRGWAYNRDLQGTYDLWKQGKPSQHWFIDMVILSW